MPNRFIIEVTDAEGILSRCTITQEGTTGNDPATVGGNFRISRNSDTPRDVIRRTKASIDLYASNTQTFSELFTEAPNQWLAHNFKGFPDIVPRVFAE